MTNPNGRFGIHGGQYIPETLMNAVIELEEAYNHYKNDPEFNRELTELFNEYAGRPSRLYFAEKMTKEDVYKRQELHRTSSCTIVVPHTKTLTNIFFNFIIYFVS